MRTVFGGIWFRELPDLDLAGVQPNNDAVHEAICKVAPRPTHCPSGPPGREKFLFCLFQMTLVVTKVLRYLVPYPCDLFPQLDISTVFPQAL